MATDLDDMFDASAVPATDVIVIGASAGGIAAVRTLLNGFDEKLSAAILVVVHTSPEGPGMLSSVLDRSTRLTVVTATDRAPIRDGHVYVAPPDNHLVVERSQVRLSRGPREHRFRPAIDPLFRTAAQSYGERTLGVVLSGHLADGTHGLTQIKQAGGVTLVQDPDEAAVPSMPLNAMRRVAVDYVLPAQEMPRIIMGLLQNRRGKSPQRVRRGELRSEKPSAERPGPDALRSHELKGPPSPFTCPDCGGTLWELHDNGLVRYRCHVGHGFSAESLRTGMDEQIEDTLWTALRALEEAIELRSRMRARAKSRQLSGFIATLNDEIEEMEQRANALRRLLMQPSHPVETKERRPRRRTANA